MVVVLRASAPVGRGRSRVRVTRKVVRSGWIEGGGRPEARSSYPAEIVVELQSETTEDLESNVARIVQWIEAWKADHPAQDGS